MTIIMCAESDCHSRCVCLSSDPKTIEICSGKHDDWIRRNFPAIRGVAYLASAGRAPMPACTIEAMHSELRQESGKLRYILDERPVIKDFRTQASGFIGADKDEVAFVTSTTNGINLFANAVRWKSGDNIVIGDVEYPSNIFPWVRIAERRGLEIRRVRAKNGLLSIEDYEKAVDDRTRILPISLVQFSTGQRMDIARLSEICDRHGALLFLDAIQALGAIRIDVHRYNIAGLSAGGYKWLCGPLGSGVLYISNSVREELEPELISWFGLEEEQRKSLWKRVISGGDLIDGRVRMMPNAHAFDHSFENYIEVVGLTESMRFLRDIGLDRIERRIFWLTDYFIERLDEEDLKLITPRKQENRAGILAFSFWKGRITHARARRIERSLGKVKLVVRMNHVRSATHFFNSKEDIDAAIGAIRRISRSQRI